MKKLSNVKKAGLLCLTLAAAFFVGAGVSKVVNHNREAVQTSVLSESENWGLGFQTDGMPPTANATADELKEYNTYYIGDTSKKVIYLTFDAGYENGNTEPILDALKKHNVHATFFLVGNYVKTSPELVKRMVEDGNIVGNHTYSHPDMSAISTKEAFEKEINGLESMVEEVTGEKMTKFYRPPQGKYSLENLKMAQELGYKTFFWSLAYVDWYQDKQPTHEEALDKLTKRIHPGAIVLLHSTSKTNGEILDELLTKWEDMGYSFGTLADLVAESDGNSVAEPGASMQVAKPQASK